MSIRKYIAYLRTVETGSITQAANELGYTQSAVSKMISDLEQDWQVKLLTRNHSGIEISSDGMVLLPTIREIVKDYEDLNFAVSELHGVQSGTLRLGCFTSLAISLLPEILKDFLENWKQHAIGYYREKRIRFIEYREGLKAKERAARLEALQTLPSLEKYRELYKGRELTDYDLANLWPRRDVDAFLSERGLEYHQIQKKLREAGDQITLRLLEIHNEDEREAWLEKTMEEEKRAKLLDLIGRIMSTVGTITDAAALYIGPEGDINGIIVGTEGKAKIQTIGAGGYNIQCFHFRTLIHEIK